MPPTRMHQDALYYLYSELKKHKISLSNAEQRPNTPYLDKKNIERKILIIEYLIDITIKHE